MIRLASEKLPPFVAATLNKSALRSLSKSSIRNVSRPTLPSILDSVQGRLSQDLRVRRTLPGIGRLHIDRKLPFLCVYRQPADVDDTGTERLVKAEASYLVVSDREAPRRDVAAVVKTVASTLTEDFGAFLLVEIWAAPDGGASNDPAAPHVRPRFTIHADKGGPIGRAVDALARRLRRVKVLKQGVEVSVARDGRTSPPGLPKLMTKALATELSCFTIGVVAPPVYRRANSTEEFPLLARSLRRSVSLALRQGFFEFTRSCTSHRPAHYHALGRKAVVKAVWDIDRRLAEVSDQFDYLLQLTPVNTTSAWKEFRASGFEKTPEFHYRPLPVDPAALKRQLYKVVIDRVEDPALQRVFQQQQEEIELKLTMLRDRDTPKFLFESLQLFGGVDDDLHRHAISILNALEGKPKKGEDASEPTVTASRFAKRARTEFKRYQREMAGFAAEAHVTKEVSGVIVSQGNLLINPDVTLTESRAQALIAHEVGTHVVTYFNGKAQPFHQLHAGLAGYEELQEGLAVLSEHLVDGLSNSRMRQLAGRVVAVRRLTDGASFVETFRELTEKHGFAQRAAYNITMRVYRSGGFTKDAVYLRGLQTIVRYLQKGGELDPLLVGKIAADHIPIIIELQHRKVLSPAAITPRHLRDESCLRRLDELRAGDQGVLLLIRQEAKQ